MAKSEADIVDDILIFRPLSASSHVAVAPVMQPAPRRLFVHIGTHKTGTTSIQKFLRDHAGEFRDCGILVPASGTLSADSGHHNIAWQLRDDSRYSNAVAGVDALVTELAASEADCAVVSSEDFEFLVHYPAQLRAFDARFEAIGFATTYVVYFREPESYARSLHCELVSAGLADDFAAFRRSIDTLGYVRAADDLYYEFRYDRFVRAWQDIVGAKLVTCSYDDAIHGAGLLPSFLTTIGASPRLIDASRQAPIANTMFDKFQQVSQELAAIKASTCWRITAPLRAIAKLGMRHHAG